MTEPSEFLNKKSCIIERYVKNVQTYSNHSGSDKICDIKHANVRNAVIVLYSNWSDDYISFLCKSDSGMVKKKNHNLVTAWKVSKYGIYSSPYFPAFQLNMERYSVQMRENTDQKKLRIWTLLPQRNVTSHFP